MEPVPLSILVSDIRSFFIYKGTRRDNKGRAFLCPPGKDAFIENGFYDTLVPLSGRPARHHEARAMPSCWSLGHPLTGSDRQGVTLYT